MTNTKNRYAIFSKKTFNKTGTMKFSRKFTTRDAAREWKRTQTEARSFGIYDVVRGVAIR
jgi:hypothetical protein